MPLIAWLHPDPAVHLKLRLPPRQTKPLLVADRLLPGRYSRRK